jgi:hypothetical protein
MKAQRRHELKTNTLAEALAKAPHAGQRYGTVALTAAIGVLLVVFLVRYRLTATQQRLARATDNLAICREDIDQIKSLAPTAALAPDISQATELYRDTSSRLDSVLADADSSSKVAAEALVARGDLNWYMASVALSTTQPSTEAQSPSDMLGGAQAAYQQVISAYPQEYFSVATARFGLAAIAENRMDWDEAKRQYQAVLDDSESGVSYHRLAQSMMATLEQLRQAAVIAGPSSSLPSASATGK